MPEAFPYGSRMILSATFRDGLSGAAVEPTTVVAKFARPTGGTTTYTYPADPEIVKSGATFRVQVDCNASGVWRYRFEAAGTYVGAGERSFTIRQSEFYP